MKKLLPFLVLFISLLAVNVNGQDTLYLKNHKMFDVKILKSTNKSIDYRFSDYPGILDMQEVCFYFLSIILSSPRLTCK